MNEALFLFMFAWLFALLYWLLFRYKRRVSVHYFGPEWTPKGLYRPSNISFVVRAVCLVVSWALVCIALIAPLEQFKRGTSLQVQTPDIDELVFVLDVSHSMLAEDTSTKESRLSRAKEIISQIVQRLAGVNVSLVTFDGKVRLVVPPTEDYLYFRILLDAVSVDTSDTFEQTALVDFLQHRIKRSAFEKSHCFVVLSDANMSAVGILNAKWNVIGFGTPDQTVIHGRFFDEQKVPLLTIVQAIEADITVVRSVGETKSVEQMTAKTFFVLFAAFFFILLALLLPQGVKQ